MNESQAPPQAPPGVAKGMLRDNLEVVCFAVLLILFFKTFVGQQFTIPSASMRNTLQIGDHVLVNKFLFAVPQWSWEARLFPMRAPARGDIVIFRYPGNREEDWVKRCVALPGDSVAIRDKRLFVNGLLVTGPWEHHIVKRAEGPVPGPWPWSRNAGPGEGLPRGYVPPLVWPFADPAARPGHELVFGFRDDLGPVTVPAGHLMAMGDNRDNSADSRYWGFLPMDHLRGRPFIVWWSFREGGNDDTDARVPGNPGDVLMNFLDGARHFLSWTRWERTGTLPR
ncbi:MAG: signal peptidase I [Holophaga sp.]|nr:signal peptidase I [Holophaga sp.]